jgi:hypothetical protein
LKGNSGYTVLVLKGFVMTIGAALAMALVY